MNRTTLFALLFAGLAAGCATPEPQTPAAPQAGADGLVSVSSGRLDQLSVRPGGEISAYRKVLIDPVAVELNSDWLRQRGANYNIRPTYPRYKDAEQVARETATSVSTSLAKAFRAAGFEVVETPAPGVMRVTAKVNDLFINAPDTVSPAYTRNLTRDAGDAYLTLEARDAVDGKALARVQHHAISRETPRGNQADDPHNALWMDTLYERWAENCAKEISFAQRDARASLK